LRVLGSVVSLLLAALSALEIASPPHEARDLFHASLAALAALGAAAMAIRARPAPAPELRALRKGLELLRGFDAAVLVLGDAAGRILFVNDVAAEVYGRTREELLGMQLADLRHASDPSAPGPWRAADVDDPRRTLGAVHERADGTPFPVEISSQALVLDGRPHSFTVIHDVTEERLAHAAMAEGFAQHRAIFRSVPMVQFSLDADGRFTTLEGRGLEGLKVGPDELVGRSLFELAQELPGLVACFARALRGEVFSAASTIGARSFDVHWAPLAEESGSIRGVTGVALDVTARVAAERARKETEAQLVAAERLASMGRLAAGVAHEINNPLAFVMSNLELASERIQGSGDEELVALVGEARLGAERVRDIVRDLRVFARSDGEAGGGCDAANVARVSLAMARNELRHRARVETQFEEVGPVAIPERQLGQILVNLLVNAAHAIREGAARENVIRLAVRSDGPSVLIELRDSGCGMRPEVRDRIFEPFFTTKQGEGMGLGLALCKTMVQEAGGRIAVESAPGEGSTFRVWLPTVEAVAATSVTTPVPRAATADSATRPRRPAAVEPLVRSKLLVVDDEPLIGRTVARALAEHDVDYVPDAREALSLLLCDGVRYDAVICDLMMPEMSGMDLAQRLVDASHELSKRIVFLTGGAFTDRARAFVALTHAPVLHKPFERQHLKECVASVIRGG
jgi:PAS domain S-box-containing protein